MGPVSITPQVSVSPKASPTRTDVRSVFHQQRIGSDSACPARGGSFGAAGGLGAGLAVAATAAGFGGAAGAAAGACADAAGADASQALAARAPRPKVQGPRPPFLCRLIMSSSEAAARP